MSWYECNAFRQLNSFLSLVCLLCHEEQVENIEYVSKQDFVLSCLLYLYRCVRLLRHGNLFSSFSEELGADIGEEKNRIIMEMEFKCQYHLIHHVVHLSMIHSLTKQSLSYTCADKVSTCSSASWDHLDPKYPSESLIRWFMELGKYTQLVDALHFSDNIATIRFLIGSHFLKWLEYCGVVQNLQDGKLTNVSEVLQLFMDLMLIRDICLVQQDSPSIAEQESNISIHTKWEEYSSLVENFLGNQSLPNDWKQQIHFHICFHLDTMRHVFGKLSIRNQSKQEVSQMNVLLICATKLNTF